MSDVTALLSRWRDGDARALDELVPLVYAELRQLADAYLSRERSGHTLQPTALVHEAYLRLLQQRDAGFNNRIHFYGAGRDRDAPHPRRPRPTPWRRQARRRPRPDQLDDALMAGVDPAMDFIALDEALARLAAQSPAPARVVELRYFGGLSVAETAALMDVAPATVKRHWAFARAWLHRELAGTA